MTAEPRVTAIVKPSARARASNLKRILHGVDGRSAPARRYRDLIAQMVSELGGLDVLPMGGMALVRQAAVLTIQAEALQSRILRDEPVDANDLVRTSNALDRVMKSLRTRKPIKDRQPTLKEHLAARAALKAQEAPAA